MVLLARGDLCDPMVHDLHEIRDGDGDQDHLCGVDRHAYDVHTLVVVNDGLEDLRDGVAQLLVVVEEEVNEDLVGHGDHGVRVDREQEDRMGDLVDRRLDRMGTMGQMGHPSPNLDLVVLRDRVFLHRSGHGGHHGL